MTFHPWLAEMVNRGASDLHLSVGLPVYYRVHGMLQPDENRKVDTESIAEFLGLYLTDAELKNLYEKRDHDCAIEAGGHRFRANVFFNRFGLAAVLRGIEPEPPTLEKLGTPKVLESLCDLEHGLVLVTGATGSGKSSTLAAMVNLINQKHRKHILTVEDPIEFVHSSKKSLVTQREVGRDTNSFKNALKSALREDPDVILVGEMRDSETIGLALTAAETGHLVFGTLHSSTAPRAVLRLIDAMPAAERDMARTMLAASFAATISQQLLQRIGGGRVGAFEVLIGNSAVRNMILENQVGQLVSAMQTGSRFGMQTMEDCISGLVRSGIVDRRGLENAEMDMPVIQETGKGQQPASVSRQADQQGYSF